MELQVPDTFEHIKDHFFLFVFLIIGLFNFPLLVRYPGPGLDPSWGIGISVAFSEGMQFGKDIIFTYGPLSFLENPLLNEYLLWELAVIFIVIVHFLFLVALYLLLHSYSARWYHYLFFVPILILVLPMVQPYPHWELLMSNSIFLYLVLIRDKRSPLIYCCLAGIGLLLAINSFLKFDMMVNCFVLIGLFSVLFFVIHRKIAEGIVLAVSFAFSWILLWLIAGQDLSHISSYLIGGLEITRGYTAAMSTDGPFRQVFICLCILVLFCIFFGEYIIQKNYQACIFLTLNSFIIFSAFKSVVVRHDNFHFTAGVWIFLLILSVLIVALDYHKKKVRRKPAIVLKAVAIMFIILLIALITVSAPWVWESNVTSYSSANHLAFGWMQNRTDYELQVQIQKDEVMSKYGVDPELIRLIGNSSIDVIPWDTALAWAYSLNWSPRPVFQSYSAYTSYLDDANSMHMISAGPPEKILFSYKSIDGRYPLFDEPRTFSALLDNYTFEGRSGEFILLTRSADSSPRESEPLGMARSSMGEDIPVPEYEGEIFGEVNLGYSPYGSILNVIYKPDPVYIRFKLKNGVITQRYRLIPETAKNGLFLSKFVGDRETLAWVLKGNLINDIESIRVETDHPVLYSDSITIQFTGTPHALMHEGSILISHPITFEKVVHQEEHPSYSFVTVDGVEKPAFFEHPMIGGSIISMDDVPAGNATLMRIAIALDPQIWSPEKGDGVEYRIYINSVDDENLIFSQYIDPKNNLDERKWNEYEVGIPSHTERNLTLFFVTFPGPRNDPAWDWAWWGGMEFI